MNNAHLLDALRGIAAPSNVEEWMLGSHGPQPQTESEPASAEYRRGVRDVLAALGALSTKGEVVSPMAYYFVQSLQHAIDEGTLNEGAWLGKSNEACAGVGARLVQLLESARLNCTPDPAPLRIVRASTAVIKAQQAGQDVYLMQFDDKAQQFQPIGGKQELSDSSSEAALAREICEELNLIAQLDEDFKAKPLALDIQVNEVSASLHVLTRYYHSFFHVTDVRFTIPLDDTTRWLPYSELLAGRTEDGYAVSTLFNQYIPGVLPTLGYSV
jgi:8-oxo-dGTP pyrophosphatase MutT (NUDIX family)